MRRAEAQEACRLVGFTRHESLVNDFEVFYERRTLARLAALVRRVAPDILLTHSPSDYMEDHENACRLAVSAAFARGMRNMPTDPPTPAVDRPVTVYHAQPHGNRDPLGAAVRPTHFVDVGGEVLEQKAAMLACHRSQQQWLDESQGFASYLETMRGLMREVGEWSGRFEHAEGWRRRLTPRLLCPRCRPARDGPGIVLFLRAMRFVLQPPGAGRVAPARSMTRREFAPPARGLGRCRPPRLTPEVLRAPSPRVRPLPP